jgi:DNA primase
MQTTQMASKYNNNPIARFQLSGQPKVNRGLIEHIKQVVDVELVLSNLGIILDRINGRTGRTACPFHGGTNKSAFSIDLGSGYWNCFSSHCHVGYSDIVGLVQLSLGCNFIDAVLFLAGVCGVNISDDYSKVAHIANIKKDLSDYVRRTEKISTEIDLCTIYNIEELVYGWIQNRTDFFYKEGYSYEIQDYFEVGSRVDRYGVPRACFPIRDNNGRIIGWDGRRTDGQNDRMRYFAEPPGLPKGKILYNYHRAKHFVPQSNGYLFLVEGYKACWSMVQAGYLNAAACMGAGIQGEQGSVLAQNLSLKSLILILDGDDAGRNGSRRAKSDLGYFCDITVIDMPDGKDPSNITQQQLHQIISENLRS